MPGHVICIRSLCEVPATAVYDISLKVVHHPSNEYLRKVFRLRVKDSWFRRNDSGGLCIPYRTVLFTLIGRKLRSDKLFQQVITG